MLFFIREGVKKNGFFWDFVPNIGPHPPTTHVWDKVVKKPSFFTIFGALIHHKMARYDLPTYVLHVLGHFWMFAVKITEWLFSLKSLGLWTHLWTHLPIVCDKVPNKSVFFTPSLTNQTESKYEISGFTLLQHMFLKQFVLYDYSVLVSKLYSQKKINVPNYTKLQKHQFISLISQCDNHKHQNQIPAQIVVGIS